METQERVNGGNEKIVPQGHWLYVRQLRTKKTDDDGDVKVFHVEDPENPPAKWCRVLAKGARVGMNRSDESNAQWGPYTAARLVAPPPWHVDNAVEVGDDILIPGSHVWGIIRSTVSDTEFFVDESVPIAISTPE